MRKALDLALTLFLALFFMFSLVYTASMLVKSTTDHYNQVLSVDKL